MKKFILILTILCNILPTKTYTSDSLINVFAGLIGGGLLSYGQIKIIKKNDDNPYKVPLTNPQIVSDLLLQGLTIATTMASTYGVLEMKSYKPVVAAFPILTLTYIARREMHYAPPYQKTDKNSHRLSLLN